MRRKLGVSVYPGVNVDLGVSAGVIKPQIMVSMKNNFGGDILNIVFELSEVAIDGWDLVMISELTAVLDNIISQIKSEWIYEVIDFPNNQLKNFKDFCPKSLFEA